MFPSFQYVAIDCQDMLGKLDLTFSSFVVDHLSGCCCCCCCCHHIYYYPKLLPMAQYRLTKPTGIQICSQECSHIDSHSLFMSARRFRYVIFCSSLLANLERSLMLGERMIALSSPHEIGDRRTPHRSIII